MYYYVEYGHVYGQVFVDAFKCKCPKFELGEGYSKAQEDQIFTGLEDTNQDKIYEGDLVVFMGNQEKKYEVVWGDGRFVIIPFGDVDVDDITGLDSDIAITLKIVGSSFLQQIINKE